MPLHVVCFSSYLATIHISWRSDDWYSHKFVHAIKGHELNGYAYIPVLGNVRRLNNANRDSAIDWFAEMVGDYFARKKIVPPFGLIPIPNSKCTKSSSTKPQTLRLARAIAKRIGEGVEVEDCLRWKKDLGSASSEGGPRDAGVLYDNCAVIDELDEDIPYILVDDVLTSGGHLQACAARVRNVDAEVSLAVCAGRTSYEQPKNAFAIIEETLADYEP